MALQLWETLKEAIVAYTGLTPATFFTVFALVCAVYYYVRGLFSSPDQHPSDNDLDEQMPPLRPPVQLGEITEEELRAYDGSDRDKPLLMAIKGQIYDVSQSRMFYGPGGPYALFAGKDASRALAKMSFEEKDLTGDISGLGPFELDALQDWEYKFMSKYVKVGTVKSTVPVTEAESTGEPSESTPRDANAAKPTENGLSETAAVKSDETLSNVDADKVGTVKSVPETAAESTGEPLESTSRGANAAKPTENGPSETAAVKIDETLPSNVDADKE